MSTEFFQPYEREIRTPFRRPRMPVYQMKTPSSQRPVVDDVDQRLLSILNRSAVAASMGGPFPASSDPETPHAYLDERARELNETGRLNELVGLMESDPGWMPNLKVLPTTLDPALRTIDLKTVETSNAALQAAGLIPGGESAA